MISFSKLTPKQLRVFEQIAINNDAGHPAQTLKALERRGLIESLVDTADYRRGVADMFVKHYHVPVNVHMAWCQWCAERTEDDKQ